MRTVRFLSGVGLALAMTVCGACSSAAKKGTTDPHPVKPTADAAPATLPGEGQAPLESPATAPTVALGDTMMGDLPYHKSHFYKFTLTAGASVLIKCTTRIPGDEMYPKTIMSVLDSTGQKKLIEWHSSLWDSHSEFTADTAGDYFFEMYNDQYDQYPLTIHYTVIVAQQ
jgi:hypothetical protein